MVATELTYPMRTPEWFKDIRFAFSLKSDGQMSFKRAAPAVVAANRKRFFQAHGLDIAQVVAGELVHGAGVMVITGSDAGRGASAADWLPDIDGMVTADINILMLTTHADCAPVIIYDPKHRVLGQAHAGWRSLRAGIIERLVQTVRSFNGSGPESLMGWIGPTIRACCYPVGAEVAGQFPQECRILVRGEERLDLARFIRMEFARLNMNPSCITDSGVCTACDETFSSFRRDGDETAAMALVTGL